MGAGAVVKTMYGKYGKAGDAFTEAQEEADCESGHGDGYSGDINCCDWATPYTGRHPNPSSRNFYNWVWDMAEKMPKRECQYIELPKYYVAKNKPYYLKGKRGVKGYLFFGSAPY